MVDDRSEDNGSLPGSERPKRAAPTIDLEATEVSDVSNETNVPNETKVLPKRQPNPRPRPRPSRPRCRPSRSRPSGLLPGLFLRGLLLRSPVRLPQRW